MVREEFQAVREDLGFAEEASFLYPVDRIPGVDPARLARRPLTVRVLLENLLRHYDPRRTTLGELRDLAEGKVSPGEVEVPFFPGRVLLQDFTGVPVVVDLTAIRSAAAAKGIDPGRVNPRIPVDLVVDHSVQVDSFGQRNSLLINLDREYDRNGERYALLRWAQDAYRAFRVVPPGSGIVHQVNLEYLATVVERRPLNGGAVAFPDTVLGTDSHTTMVNGLSVLGWGVGGIEAEAVLLGEPYFLSRPEVVGVRLVGTLPEGTTATDLVLTITHELRRKGVVEKFVEFTGPGIAALSVPDRATLSNMCPEYGATAALFPIDAPTIAYLRGTGRPSRLIGRVEAYARRQGLWWEPGTPEPEFEDVLEVDLARIVPTVSGPKNPEEAVSLPELPRAFAAARDEYRRAHPRPGSGKGGSTATYPSDDPLHPYNGHQDVPPAGSASGASALPIHDGAAVIAAITSCTNTSNPSVMMGAGIIAQRARVRGLRPPPHVKTSLAPGSKVVTEYLQRAGVLADLEALGFGVVGYGCTTCIGNSGPLIPAVDRAVREQDAYVAAVLSGNRNFEARIHTLVRANFLASPMLVVAFALAGRVDLDLTTEPLGTDASGEPVFLKELWPSAEEVRRLVEANLKPEIFEEKYRKITQGDAHWASMDTPTGTIYPWDERSTYLRNPPYFDLPLPALQGTLVSGARVLALLGDRVSTDHISPAGEILEHTPAGDYLRDRGVAPIDFNTYGSRRGNHEVMARGTFANSRLINQLATPREGGWTRHQPSQEEMTIFAAAERYGREGVPLVVLAGASYGQGSSRDWAAKGPRLLGVHAVIAKSYERIHRGNLVGMGVLPLQFRPNEGASELGLTGRERLRIEVPGGGPIAPRMELSVTAETDDGQTRTFTVRSRIDSPVEFEYYRAGGILPHILAGLARTNARLT